MKIIIVLTEQEARALEAAAENLIGGDVQDQEAVLPTSVDRAAATRALAKLGTAIRQTPSE